MFFYFLCLFSSVLGADFFSHFPSLKDKIPYVQFRKAPTPLIFLKNLSTDFEVPIYMKADNRYGKEMEENAFVKYGGNKPRKLEFLFRDLLKQKEKVDCVVTFGGRGSNHAVATSCYGKLLNVPVILLLSPQAKSEYTEKNILLDEYYGAKIISYVTAEEKNKHVEAIKQNYQNPYFIPVGGSNEIGVLGFINAGLEFLKQCVEKNQIPSHVFLPLGSAGTITGLLLAQQVFLKNDQVNYEESILEKIKAIKFCGVIVGAVKAQVKKESIQGLFERTISHLALFDQSISTIKFSENSLYIDSLFSTVPYGESTEQVHAALKKVKEVEEIFLDPVYTGKAMAALLQFIGEKNKEEFSKDGIVFWNTFSGDTYREPAILELFKEAKTEK